ncbi:craniofacial development protein 1-like [Mya arenaria]|uniref:craniofacial development protein 1-like n=1 Tax=Mya arenaria TaxID=6604 RepID=UPI0022E71818|nr:craniofacial development protein 1-like [Mya arenaria]
MSDEEDFPDSTDDEDYVPSDGEAVSEEEHSGDEENLDALKEDGVTLTSGRRRKTSKKKAALSGVRKRKGGIQLEGETEVAEEEKNTELEQQIKAEQEAKKVEQEKKKSDDLWASFMSDVGKRPEKKTAPAPSGSLASTLTKKQSTPSKSETPPSDPTTSTPASSTVTQATTKSTITVTKVYDFAGEAVKVTKELDVNSKEGQAELKKQQSATLDTSTGVSSTSKPGVASLASTSSLLSGGVKRPGAGGLGGVLAKINKKPKMGTLEKSKLDWEDFKQKEGIEEELAIHNRGKQSYIERMKFLQRSDQRQFEIEKSLRLGSTSKR